MSHADPDLEASLERYLRASGKVMLLMEAVREARLPSWRLAYGAVYHLWLIFERLIELSRGNDFSASMKFKVIELFEDQKWEMLIVLTLQLLT